MNISKKLVAIALITTLFLPACNRRSITQIQTTQEYPTAIEATTEATVETTFLSKYWKYLTIGTAVYVAAAIAVAYKNNWYQQKEEMSEREQQALAILDAFDHPHRCTIRKSVKAQNDEMRANNPVLMHTLDVVAADDIRPSKYCRAQVQKDYITSIDVFNGHTCINNLPPEREGFLILREPGGKEVKIDAGPNRKRWGVQVSRRSELYLNDLFRRRVSSPLGRGVRQDLQPNDKIAIYTKVGRGLILRRYIFNTDSHWYQIVFNENEMLPIEEPFPGFRSRWDELLGINE